MDKRFLSRSFVLALLLLMFNYRSFTELGGTKPVAGDMDQSHTNTVFFNYITAYPEMARFDSVMESFIRRWGISGASVALVKNEKLVYAKGYGLADKENNELVQPTHLFRIASISKLITAIGIMKLVEAGELSLHDKVFGHEGILNDSVFLDISDRRVSQITVAHLLNHTGGWSSRFPDPMFMTRHIGKIMHCNGAPTLDDVIRYVLRYRHISYKPGTRSSYSNFGYCVLGKIIEKKTGLTYEKYIQNAVLAPIGIFDMRLAGNTLDERCNNEVKYYSASDKILACDGRDEYVERHYGGNDIRLLGAAGGWLASAISLMKLASAIDGMNYRPDVLSEKSISLMTCRDSSFSHPFGWKGVRNNDWWRTGSFSGTSGLLYRQADSITWVVILNSSTWKGASFPNYIHANMRKALSVINEWPVYDLFQYRGPEAIQTIRFTSVFPILDSHQQMTRLTPLLPDKI